MRISPGSRATALATGSPSFDGGDVGELLERGGAGPVRDAFEREGLDAEVPVLLEDLDEERAGGVGLERRDGVERFGALGGRLGLVDLEPLLERVELRILDEEEREEEDRAHGLIY